LYSDRGKKITSKDEDHSEEKCWKKVRQIKGVAFLVGGTDTRPGGNQRGRKIEGKTEPKKRKEGEMLLVHQNLSGKGGRCRG